MLREDGPAPGSRVTEHLLLARFHLSGFGVYQDVGD